MSEQGQKKQPKEPLSLLAILHKLATGSDDEQVVAWAKSLIMGERTSAGHVLPSIQDLENKRESDERKSKLRQEEERKRRELELLRQAQRERDEQYDREREEEAAKADRNRRAAAMQLKKIAKKLTNRRKA